MARPLRHLSGRTLVEITCRTVQGRLLLRPSPLLNETVLGALGRAQRLYGMELCAVVALSNHLHLIAAPGSVGQLASFMQHFLSKLAREVSTLHDWRDKVWARRYRAIPISDEPEAQVERLRYLLENGVKEGLVAHPRDWPGVHCVRTLLDGDELAGVWVDRTAAYEARRRHQELIPGENLTREVVTLAPLPCWASLDEAERRRRVDELVDDVVAAARAARHGLPVLGAEGVARQAPHERPLHHDRSPAPAVHAASRAMRIAMKLAYRAFLELYRVAAQRFRAGDRLAKFPPGCFPPALPAIAWGPS